MSARVFVEGRYGVSIGTIAGFGLGGVLARIAGVSARRYGIPGEFLLVGAGAAALIWPSAPTMGAAAETVVSVGVGHLVDRGLDAMRSSRE